MISRSRQRDFDGISQGIRNEFDFVVLRVRCAFAAITKRLRVLAHRFRDDCTEKAKEMSRNEQQLHAAQSLRKQSDSAVIALRDRSDFAASMLRLRSDYAVRSKPFVAMTKLLGVIAHRFYEYCTESAKKMRSDCMLPNRCAYKVISQ
jgi:hypothetical protein